MCGGIYRRCANDGGAREEQRGVQRGRKKANERGGGGGRESRRPRVTRGVERRVTQVQSSAPACPRAVLTQQRQEAAEHQRLQPRQVGWNNKPTGQEVRAARDVHPRTRTFTRARPTNMRARRYFTKASIPDCNCQC